MSKASKLLERVYIGRQIGIKKTKITKGGKEMKKLALVLLSALVLLLSSCGGTPIPAGDFSLTLNTANITIARGSNGDITITVNKTNGFSDLVTFSISPATPLPAGVTENFNPVSHADGSVLTLNVAATATPGTKAITITGTGGGKTHTVNFSLTVTNVPDTTKPTIVDYSPADGARGVLSFAKITIKFSEPMDQLATQNAFQSTDIGLVSYDWKDGGKTMVVTPSNPLKYSSNTSYKYYHFKITTTAKDRAGNSLAAAESVRFATMRTHGVYFRANKTLDGYIWDHNGGIYRDLVYLRVGDQAVGNRYARSFLSFDVGAYLASKHAIGVKKALLKVYQYKMRGNPYNDLKGNLSGYQYLRLYHMDYGSSLEKNDFIKTPISRGSIEFSRSYSVGYKNAIVTNWVADDYRHRRGRANRSQFKLQFAKDTDGDHHDDHVEFYSGNYSNLGKVPILWVWYYAP